MWINKEDVIDVIMTIILTVVLIIVFSYYGEQPTKEDISTGSGSKYIGNTGEYLPINGNGNEITNNLIQEEVDKEQTYAYNISDTERNLIEHVVMGLAENEDTITQKAIAQCILNACIAFDERPDYIVKILRYTEYRPTPSTEVKQSVSNIFDKGELVLEQDVLFLYNYKQSDSIWHESQEYVCTIGSYKFFK